LIDTNGASSADKEKHPKANIIANGLYFLVIIILPLITSKCAAVSLFLVLISLKKLKI
jgi:hypothetical protein